MARLMIRDPKPGDQLIVQLPGGGGVDPNAVPTGSYVFRVMTADSAVRQIEITANM